MTEYAFELSLCAHLERETEAILARQLGASRHGSRVIDVLCVEPGPALEERTAITADTIPVAAIESDVGPGRMRYWRDAFTCHPDRARRAVARAVDVGFFERERRNGRTYVRQTVRYPDWFGRLRGIENKPDLGAPGALEDQLRTDVSLGIFDEVILATESHVTRAHLNRIPPAVGVWRFDPATGTVTVVREPRRLSVADPGIEPVDSRPGRTEIRIVPADEKARIRRRLAERAYGKGWRTWCLPDCANCEAGSVAGTDGLPYCTWHERLVHPADQCGVECPGYDPGDSPSVDLVAERDRRTPWRASPPGRTRTQSDLDRYE